MKINLMNVLGILFLASFTITACGGKEMATVNRVIDGDTIEVKYQGKYATVRLLNIDTPETKHPHQDVECLGPEASQFLTDMLPVGSAVTLEFDKEKTDQHNRLLAGVFKEDGTFVNEAIAQNGFAAAIKIAPNEKFYPRILKAEEEALENNRGLFDPSTSCAVPGILREANQALKEAMTAEDLVAAVERAQRLLEIVEGEDYSSTAEYLENLVQSETMSSLLTSLKSTLEAKNRDYLKAVQDIERELARQQKEEEDQRRAAEATRIAAEQAERRAAAEAARIAEQQRKEAEQIATNQAEVEQNAQQSRTPMSPTSAPEATQDPYPGYTGPRCYAPGGKTWTPCPER